MSALLFALGAWGCNNSPATSSTGTSKLSSSSGGNGTFGVGIGAGGPSSSTSGSPGSSGNTGSVSNTSNTSNTNAATSGTNANTTGQTNGTDSGTTNSNGNSDNTSDSNTSNTSGTSSTGTSGACLPNCTYAGPNNASLCCSGIVDSFSYCDDSQSSCLNPSTVSTSTSGTSSSSSSTTGFSGCYDSCQTPPNGNATYCCTGMVDSQGLCDDAQSDCLNPTTASSSSGTLGTTGSSGSGFACSPANACHSGYTCVNGNCVLNGGNGQLQITLEWQNTPRTAEDMDLHVVEPNGCEIWYGDTNRPTGTSQCGAVGSLDLDSNAGCGSIQPVGQPGADIENVIYTWPDGGGVTPPSGTYTVRVDYYENCDGASSVPFQVKIRKGNTTTTYPGVLYSADYGSAGSGTTMATFTYP